MRPSSTPTPFAAASARMAVGSLSQIRVPTGPYGLPEEREARRKACANETERPPPNQSPAGTALGRLAWFSGRPRTREIADH
jgi:hypothetical protein